MDHLPIFSATQDWPIEIPFLCEHISFEKCSFRDFPECQGWYADTVNLAVTYGHYRGLMMGRLEILRAGFTPKDCAALLQSWWYFGLLKETLGIGTDDISAFVTRSPTSGRLVITTQHLPAYIKAWKRRLEGVPPREAYLELAKAIECINHVHRLIENLANTIERYVGTFRQMNAQKPRISGIRRAADGRVSVTDHLVKSLTRPGGLQRLLEKVSQPRDITQDQDLTVDDAEELVQITSWMQNGRKILTHELEVSVCILGHTLSHAIRSVHSKLKLLKEGDIVQAGWYTPAFIKSRMIAHDFCPRLLPRLTPILLLMGNCLASSLPPIHEAAEKNAHATCTADRCSGDYEPEQSYQRLHVTPGCNCDELPQQQTYSEIQELLEAGSIPVLRVHGISINDILVEVCDAVKGPYVAISHVWSDGLGNNTNNQIYRCQWLRLQGIVEKLYHGRSELLPFWLDTICVPLAKSDGQDALINTTRKLRDAAVARMRATYWNADVVLVLDSTMLVLPVSTPLLELSLRFSFSKWMRRVWTLHEGAVAARVAIKVRDDFVLLKDLLEGLWETRFNDYSPENDSILTSLGAIECLGAWSSCLCAARDERTNQDLFTLAWNQCRDRGTARPIDRYVVLAIILGLSGQKMYDFAWEDDCSRLEYILKSTPEIPAMILFTLGPRMDTPGMGWAPTRIEHDKIFFVDDKVPGKLLPEGLLVQFEGYRISQVPDWSKRWERKGSFTTAAMQQGHVLTGACAWSMESTDPGDSGTLYTASFTTPGHHIPSVLESDTLFIIICPIRAKDKHVTRAVLVKLLNEDGDVNYVKHIAAITWTKQTAEQVRMLNLARDSWTVEVLNAIPVPKVGALQSWCIG